jgi:hypothetical protein
MEKTPMQEMIDFCKENQDGEMPPKEFLFKAFELLEKEKQVIEDSFNQGYRDGFSDAQSVTENDKDISEYSDAQDYYNQKFKQ